MADNFGTLAVGMTGPAINAAAVTPDDANDLGNVGRGLYVGGSGDVKVDTAAGDTVIFRALVSGVIHPIRAKRVHATGTTATNIVAVW